MSTINLLPWREEKRKELQSQFIMMLSVVAVLAAAAWGAVHYYHVQLIDVENSRISHVEQNIAAVDKKIKEIKELEKEKERLLSRMRAIEQLQGNRPLIVRFFDELIASLPEGMTVTKITQKGAGLTIDGLAQSNAGVSSFMRKLEGSKWLANPRLKIIKESKEGGNKPVNSFTLTFSQVIPKIVEAD
ncbi:MAG TPA: pilus assembly protein PilN [Thiotrichaceae bacterium]|jgi:type IV pilus assembly protein PilN|nr:pilus assembly protein PilN [Thiotrichaceae bacterium]HIM08946.1 pilus assembly protein PilN [Gammaproteobacteria bacterium]